MKRVAVVGAVAATVYGLWVPDANGFREPFLARILFVHVPCAFVCSGLIFLASFFGIRRLAKRGAADSVRLEATNELALLFGVLTMLTGMLFSEVQWGKWWFWDPRQTSFLLVTLILASAVGLRAGLTEGPKRDVAIAAYSAASLLPNMFLVFVFPRLPQVQQDSLHPSQTVVQNQLDTFYRIGLYGTLAVLIVAVIVAYRQRVALGMAERRQLESYGTNTDGAHSARSPVVRPLPVHAKDLPPDSTN